ncbi:MAG: hypothetical protein AAGH38_09875 [Pseudomonadota bacterium]
MACALTVSKRLLSAAEGNDKTHRYRFISRELIDIATSAFRIKILGGGPVHIQLAARAAQDGAPGRVC